MNFLKSAWFMPAEEEEEEDSENEEKTNQEEKNPPEFNPSEPSIKEENEEKIITEFSEESSSSFWNIGGIVKSLQSRSEEVIEAYKRDLQDFKSGLQKETEVISKAVKDLPTSLEVGASVAQESLESVGQALDDFSSSVWRGTADIISEGKDLISKMDEENENNNNYSNSGVEAMYNGKFSRVEAQIRAMQMDSNSYVLEPEDTVDFESWKSGSFRIDEKEDEIEKLCQENRVVDEIRARLVPDVMDYEIFWSRYFYRLWKIQQAEEARVSLVKRAIHGDDEEEELTWEFEDEDEVIVGESGLKSQESSSGNVKDVGIVKEGLVPRVSRSEISEENSGNEDLRISDDNGKETESIAVAEGNSKGIVIAEGNGKRIMVADDDKVETVNEIVVESAGVEKDSSSSEKLNEEVQTALKSVRDNVKDETPLKSVSENVEEVKHLDADEEKTAAVPYEGKEDYAESSRNSEFSIVSSKPSSVRDEDDLGWDEIEDLSAVDERKSGSSSSPRQSSVGRDDIRKRLSVEPDDEDLSWDVDEDDDDVRK